MARPIYDNVLNPKSFLLAILDNIAILMGVCSCLVGK
jgi:hypothetical protein